MKTRDKTYLYVRGLALSAAVAIPIFYAMGTSKSKQTEPLDIKTKENIRVVYQIKTDEWKQGVGSGLHYVQKLYKAYQTMEIPAVELEIHAVLHGVRVVTVKARRFEFDPSRIAVRKGDDIRLEITSEDVTHGFALADFDIDRTLEPGKTEKISFQVEKTGEHHFHCSVYCGEGHDKMHGKLIVLDRE